MSIEGGEMQVSRVQLAMGGDDCWGMKQLPKRLDKQRKEALTSLLNPAPAQN